MQKLFLSFLLFFTFNLAEAQKKVLPPIISSYGYSEYAPKLTADGRTLIFTSDISMSGQPEMYITEAVGTRNWRRAEPMNIPYKELIAFGSYAISYDGNEIIYSSKRGPKIGGYDIQFQKRNSNGWERPTNPGKPLNSGIHEMDPTLSADGKTIYFSRCETVNPKVGGCKLYMAELGSNGIWKQPEKVKLDFSSSSMVNPVILPDNKTLYFAALNEGGNYDFYMSRKLDAVWSKPKAMDFLNTDANDRYIGVTALGNVVYIHEKSTRGDFDLVMVKVPEEFQPKRVYYFEGQVTNLVGKALLSAIDIKSGEQLARQVLDPENSSFGIYLSEGHEVKIFVETRQESYGYYSEFLDLNSLNQSQKVVKEIQLPELRSGMKIPIAVSFEEESADFTVGSDLELNQIIQLMKQNQAYQFSINLYQPLQEQPDSLSEVAEYAQDSVLQQRADSVSMGLSEELLTEKEAPNKFTIVGQNRLAAIEEYLLDKGVPESMFSALLKPQPLADSAEESNTVNAEYKVLLQID